MTPCVVGYGVCARDPKKSAKTQGSLDDRSLLLFYFGPQRVRDAAAKPACTEAVIVSLGIDRADLINAHWTYFYDRDIFFTRLSTPHLQSPHNVPAGCGSLQAECYYSRRYRPLDRRPAECIEPVIRDLIRCGVLRESDKILVRRQRVHGFDGANLSFVRVRRSARSSILHE